MNFVREFIRGFGIATSFCSFLFIVRHMITRNDFWFYASLGCLGFAIVAAFMLESLKVKR